MSKTSSSSSSSPISVKDVVHKLQLCLLEGIKSESHLLIAGALLSKSDYHDVVIERSIAKMCGYPLCPNSLPSPSSSKPPRKGRYHISLREHKVYDLVETHMYCSTKCVVDSRTNTESLQHERSLALDTAKLEKVIKLFEGLSLKAEEGLGENGDFGMCNLSIKEKVGGSVDGGIVSMEEWIGPSNAIEGYVPQHDRSSKNRTVSEAGLVILPPPLDDNEVIFEEIIAPEPERLKWPKRTGVVESDFFNSGDSWFDSPPEEFVVGLSPLATMFMSLFAWISSSTLAYVYGHGGDDHEEYALINGREYPRKIVLTDGRSSEIKQTLAGCLSRALPGLVHYLRLPTPVSTIEYGMGCLLDTMSFLDPLPSLRMKQWQVFIILFVESLSVCRIPAVAPHLTNRRFFQKVFDDAQITREEYEVLKDLMLPLGRRLPQFATQSGA